MNVHFIKNKILTEITHIFQEGYVEYSQKVNIWSVINGNTIGLLYVEVILAQIDKYFTMPEETVGLGT